MVNCPFCQSKRIYPSRRRGIIERSFLTMVCVRPFRCENCDFRFYRWSLSANPNTSRQVTSN